MEDQTGLAVPEDIETLFGKSATLSVNSDFDLTDFFGSADGSKLPVGMKVEGDAPGGSSEFWPRSLQQFPGPSEAELLGSDADGDTVAIGPNADYRRQLLADGGLGDDKVFKDVAREADKASSVLFVNINALEDAIIGIVGEDDDFSRNLKPCPASE